MCFATLILCNICHRLFGTICQTVLMIIHTHTHPFNGLFSGTTWVSRYQKGKPIWILLKQETVSSSGISWAICKSAPRSRQITMPAPHHASFLQAGCPSCHPTNSVKALKASADDNSHGLFVRELRVISFAQADLSGVFECVSLKSTLFI